VKKLFVVFAVLIPVLAACSARNEPYEYEAAYTPDAPAYEEAEEAPEPVMPVIFYWYFEDEETVYIEGEDEDEPIVFTVDTSPDVNRVVMRVPWGNMELYLLRQTEGFSVFGITFYAPEGFDYPIFGSVYAENDHGITYSPIRIAR